VINSRGGLVVLFRRMPERHRLYLSLSCETHRTWAVEAVVREDDMVGYDRDAFLARVVAGLERSARYDLSTCACASPLELT
jgi:hypothetical protein